MQSSTGGRGRGGGLGESLEPRSNTVTPVSKKERKQNKETSSLNHLVLPTYKEEHRE
jgi:hypothetical protein